jgi:hypothetical protein
MTNVVSRRKFDNRCLTIAAQHRHFGAACVCKRYAGQHTSETFENAAKLGSGAAGDSFAPRPTRRRPEPAAQTEVRAHSGCKE